MGVMSTLVRDLMHNGKRSEKAVIKNKIRSLHLEKSQLEMQLRGINTPDTREILTDNIKTVSTQIEAWTNLGKSKGVRSISNVQTAL